MSGTLRVLNVTIKGVLAALVEYEWADGSKCRTEACIGGLHNLDWFDENGDMTNGPAVDVNLLTSEMMRVRRMRVLWGNWSVYDDHAVTWAASYEEGLNK